MLSIVQLFTLLKTVFNYQQFAQNKLWHIKDMIDLWALDIFVLTVIDTGQPDVNTDYWIRIINQQRMECFSLTFSFPNL